MIRIKQEKVKKVTPHYILKLKYMIGDADGNTSYSVNISEDNPFLERFCKLLDKLKHPKNKIGLCLDDEGLEYNLKSKVITKDDFEFLNRLMYENYEFEDGEPTYFKTKEENDFANEFWECICAETEYSFLCFETYTLLYVDSNGKKTEAEVV